MITIPLVLRQIARYALNTLAVLSLVLSAATVWLSVRSHQIRDQIERNMRSTSPKSLYMSGLSLMSDHGAVFIGYSIKLRTTLDPTSATEIPEWPGHEPPGDGTEWYHSIAHSGPRPLQIGSDAPPFFQRLGIGWMHRTLDRGTVPPKFKMHSVAAAVQLPWWSLTALSGTLGLLTLCWSWWLGRAARRLRRGLCGRCGYDLRATPDRCPECGTAFRPTG